jgi:hypothetical protein
VETHFPDVTGKCKCKRFRKGLKLILSIGSLELASITVQIMLLRATCPKLIRRNFPADKYLALADTVSMQAIHLVESLQINRLSAFWCFRKSPSLSQVTTVVPINSSLQPPGSTLLSSVRSWQI